MFARRLLVTGVFSSTAGRFDTMCGIFPRRTMLLRSVAHSSTYTLRVAVTVLALAAAIPAQTTVSTGSIQGSVTDPSGGAVKGAATIITGKATGQVTRRATNSQGAYASGGLVPGLYLDAAGEQVPCPDTQSGLYIRSRTGEQVRVSIPADHCAFQIFKPPR